MDTLDRKREEFHKLLSPIQEKLDILEGYTHPVNRRLVRQMIGLREFGVGYVPFILARAGILPRREFTVRFFWGKKVRLPLDRSTTEMSYLQALPEPALINFFIRTLRSEDVFYDVGASYGFYTLLAEEFIQGGSIHAFEPSPLVFPYLCKNNINVPNLTLNNVAVGDRDGEISYFQTAGFSTQSTTIPDVAKSGTESYETLTVPLVTLDEYIQKHPIPTIIKMDIEGGEAAALRGMSKCLKKHAPIVTVEVWGGGRGRDFSSPAVEFLRGLGYSAYRIYPDGHVEPEMQRDLFADGLGGNFVFKKDKK